MKQNEFPKGWDAERVARLVTDYQPQLEKPAFNPNNKLIMEVPYELGPTIRALIAKHETVA